MATLTPPNEAMRRHLNLYKESADSTAGRISATGQWDILRRSYNGSTPPLQCAIRNMGYFRSRSQYNRQNIELVSDIATVVQGDLRSQVAALSADLVRWANATLTEARRLLAPLRTNGDVEGALLPVRQQVQQLLRQAQGTLSDQAMHQEIRQRVRLGIVCSNFYEVLLYDTGMAVRGLCDLLLDQLVQFDVDVLNTFNRLVDTYSEAHAHTTQLDELITLLESGTPQSFRVQCSIKRLWLLWLIVLSPRRHDQGGDDHIRRLSSLFGNQTVSLACSFLFSLSISSKSGLRRRSGNVRVCWESLFYFAHFEHDVTMRATGRLNPMQGKMAFASLGGCRAAAAASSSASALFNRSAAMRSSFAGPVFSRRYTSTSGISNSSNLHCSISIYAFSKQESRLIAIICSWQTLL